MAGMKKNTPWAYNRGSSPLHRMNAGLKLIVVLLLSLAAFLPNLAVLSGIIIFLIVLSCIARIGPTALLRGSGPLFFIVLAILLFQALEFSPLRINTGGLREGIIFCFRLGAAFAAGSLLFTVTTSAELRKSISRLETALHAEKLKIGLSISLMLGFLPLFFVIWEDINLAWKSRGGRKSLSRLVVLIPLVIERMMVKALEKALAMESRNF